jgi:hypothetical protein
MLTVIRGCRVAGQLDRLGDVELIVNIRSR